MKNNTIRPRISSEEYKIILDYRKSKKEGKPFTQDEISETVFVKGKDKASLTGVLQTKERDHDKIIDQFIKEYGIDLDKWSIEKFTIKRWDVTSKSRDQDLKWTKEEVDGKPQQFMEGRATRKDEWITKQNYSINVAFKPKICDEKEWLKEAITLIKKDLIIPVNKYKPQLYKKDSGIALEMATLDAHFGKYAWLAETGYRNFDLKKAATDFTYATDQNLEWATKQHKLEKIFYIVGQDLFHVDNMKNHTTNGEHAMDVDGRMPKIYKQVIETVRDSINKCRDVAPVEVIWNPGNHDNMVSMLFTMMLEEIFRNDKFVSVDVFRERDGVSTRKARSWGNLLVGWTHRITTRQNVWYNELAQAFPELWGQSKFREWHHGDQHKKKTKNIVIEDTQGGVNLRQLTALSPVDKWHFENVFTDAVPGGEAFLWCKDRGVFSNLTAWTGQYEDYRNKLIEKYGNNNC